MARADDRLRNSWDIVIEGQPPRFVLEVSMPWSWERDTMEKPQIYQAMGVAEYVVFAPRRGDGGPRLFGSRVDLGSQYRACDVNRGGVLWSLALDLGLRVEEKFWLRAVNAQGNCLASPIEAAFAAEAARIAETTRSEDLRVTVGAAEAEVARLREEVRQLRGGTEETSGSGEPPQP
jgi:hypothetical protein